MSTILDALRKAQAEGGEKPDIPEPEFPTSTPDDPQPPFRPEDSGDDLDPLPTADEIQGVDVRDVELTDFSAEASAPDAHVIDAEADPERLDVGDLLGDESDENGEVPIRMLRGESHFQPDEESLLAEIDSDASFSGNTEVVVAEDDGDVNVTVVSVKKP